MSAFQPGSVRTAAAGTILRRPVRRAWGADEIAIYAPSYIEIWSPKSLAKGIGGSEEAIIRLSRELDNAGYKVTVYAHTIPGDYNGITYLSMEMFNRNDEFNLLVLWRCPTELDRKFNGTVWLWLHDVHEPEEFTERRILNVDKVVVLSEFHRSLFPAVPEDKIMYSANGLTIDYRLYDDVVRDPYKIIYSSCPTRGLENLLDWWPEIHAIVPKAHLHVYYGFYNFEQFWKDDPEKLRWEAIMKEKLIQEGITFHGRTGQDEINRTTAESGVWAYPTDFPETFCITAAKCESLGAWPVTTGYAALRETQLSGYMNSDLGRVKAETIRVLLNPPTNAERQRMMKLARERWSWAKVAQCWIKELTRAS